LEAIALELDGSIEKLVLDLLKEKPQRDPYKRYTILSYQMADVGRLLRYMQIYPDERDAYAEYFKTALADLLIQCLVLAQLYKLDFGELLQIGSGRLDEFKRKGRYVEAG
jgi:hypothetical protein